MKKLQLIAVTSVLLGSATVIGCGGGGVNSGVDGSKQASEVTDEEAQAICEATVDYQADSFDTASACRAVGLAAYFVAGFSGEEPVAACETARDACIESSETATDVDTDTCSDVTTADAEGCTATVAEVEDCLTALVDATAEALKAIPDCAEITEDDLTEVAEPETPAACESLPASCGFVEGTMGDVGDDPGTEDFGLGGAPAE